MQTIHRRYRYTPSSPASFRQKKKEPTPEEVKALVDQGLTRDQIHRELAKSTGRSIKGIVVLLFKRASLREALGDLYVPRIYH